MRLAEVCPRDCDALITFGTLMGSPYDFRRMFAYAFTRTATDFLDSMEHAIRFSLSRWNVSNIESIVERYKKIRMRSDKYWDNPRHEALWEVPAFDPSNHEYFYIVDWSRGHPEIIMLVGASGWLVYANPDYLYIERPNGKSFVYRNYSAVSSYALFMALTYKELKVIRRIVNEYTGPRHLVEGFARVHIVENASDEELYNLWKIGGPRYLSYNPASETLTLILTKLRERARRNIDAWLARRRRTLTSTE